MAQPFVRYNGMKDSQTLFFILSLFIILLLTQPTAYSGEINGGHNSNVGASGMATASNGLASMMLYQQCQEKKKDPKSKDWVPLCGMACLSAIQGLGDLASKFGSQDGASKSSGDSSGANFNPNLKSANVARDPGDLALQTQMEGIRDSLAKQGFKYDPTTNSVSVPDGAGGPKNIPAQALSSPGAAKAFGFDQKSVDSIVKATEQLNQKLGHSVDLDFDSQGGGGGGGYSGRSNSPYESDFTTNSNFKERKPSSLNSSGSTRLTRTYGNAKVGVAMDSLFELIHSKFVEREGKGGFLHE